MSADKDWLSQNHEDLYDQANQTMDYFAVASNRSRMGFAASTPQGEWFDKEFSPKYAVFKTTFIDWKNPSERTPSKTVRLYSAEAVFKPAYRQLYSGLLKGNPLVTNDDLQSMGMPLRSSGHTSSRVALAGPNVYIDTSVAMRLSFYFYERGRYRRRARPKGQRGVEMVWIMSEAPPTKMEELIHSEFSTRSPFTLSFDANQRGKTIYYAVRWENTRGEKGPWSEMASVVIP
jgi:hypothetical protein